MMSPIGDRPTADVVMLMLASVVGLSILLSGAGLFLLAALHPEYQLQTVLASFSQTVELLIGATVGYLAGKGRSPGSGET